MKLGIVIATYQRNDGSTPYFLSRALESIKNQTHQDYKVFLIGDKYENDNEFIQLSTSIIPSEKIYFKNLPIAVERERYPHGGRDLWRCGGVNAMNYGIDKSLEMGYEYVCHLDHDDYWHPQHLEMINHTIDLTQNPAFLYTRSTYLTSTLPSIGVGEEEIIESLPYSGRLIHSSVCINHSLINFRYRDTLNDIGTKNASDADMWDRIREFIEDNKNLKSYFIPSLTCYHPQEFH